MLGHNWTSMILVAGRQLGDRGDQNRCKQLQMGREGQKDTKKPLVSCSRWKARGMDAIQIGAYLMLELQAK